MKKQNNRLSGEFARLAQSGDYSKGDKKTAKKENLVRLGLPVVVLSIFFPPLMLLIVVGAVAYALLRVNKFSSRKDADSADDPLAKGAGFWEQAGAYLPFEDNEESGFSFDKEDHEHITVTHLSTQKRLEQLKIHYSAGLYTKEQYRQAKQEILSSDNGIWVED